MADNRWQDIFLHLKSKGFEIYPPSTKVGECLSKYIVVKNDGSSVHTSFSTNVDLYAVMCYVPKQRYSELVTFVNDVRKGMKEMEPMIYEYGTQTPSYYDDTFKAHMVSIAYKNYKKL